MMQIQMMKFQRMKSNMTQWISLLQNNGFVFRAVVIFVVPKTEPIHLVLVGLMVGWQVGWQADKNLVVLKKFLGVTT